MSYLQLPTRSNTDPNASSDINQLQDNFDALIDGSKRFEQVTASAVDIKENITFTNTTGTGGLYATGSGLSYNEKPLGMNGVGCYIDGTLSTGEEQVTLVTPHAFEIENVVINTGKLGKHAGGTLAVDVNYHASNSASLASIFTTQANRPQIADGDRRATSGTPDTTTVVKGGIFSFSIDNVGSATAGSDLAVTVVAK
jgi:hypothetical protein